jgi:hypothetical protein
MARGRQDWTMLILAIPHIGLLMRFLLSERYIILALLGHLHVGFMLGQRQHRPLKLHVVFPLLNLCLVNPPLRLFSFQEGTLLRHADTSPYLTQ